VGENPRVATSRQRNGWGFAAYEYTVPVDASHTAPLMARRLWLC
jgi:hypothetical protein